jgi:uncharacterized protein (DUF1501 family)
MIHQSNRRELLLGSGALFAWAHLPRTALAEGRDPRFLVIVLRGALDGLATVAPVGDPDWQRLRGENAFTIDGPTAALPLDSFFALNPAMPNLHRLYKAGQATIVHAVATPYRERSHFDGQDVLEGGFVRPGSSDTGWLNRTLAGLPAAGRVNPKQAFAVGPIAPLVARGSAPVLAWTPPRLPPASNDTMSRLVDLYRHTDPALAGALEERSALSAIADAGVGKDSKTTDDTRRSGSGGTRLFRRIGVRRCQVYGAAGWPARWRVGLRWLGHTRERGSGQGTPRSPPRCAGWRYQRS